MPILRPNRTARRFPQQPVDGDELMIVFRNSKKEYRFGGTGAGLLRRNAAPTGRQGFTNPQQLVLQACHLSKRARELDPTEPERVAIQRLYGRVTACTKVSFAFQGILATEIRDWLRRAEMATRSITARGHDVGPKDAALLGQMRRLIDSANVAVMRGFASHDAWSDFCAVADRTTQWVEMFAHHELPCRK
jgi:hypothetical protein